jgi:FemAB-related protein (PEP-CTERM system-associated)
MSVVAMPRTREAAVRVVSDVSDQQWDAYVSSHPGATVYHQSAWARLLARVFRHDVRMLAATTDGRVSGVLPLVGFRSRVFGTFAVSLPFVNYGGVLADSDASKQALLDAAIGVSRHWGASHLELRHTDHVFPALQSKKHKVGMTMPLRDTIDAQWQALDRKLRNQVRKAEKSGLTVGVGGAEDVAGFFDVFSRNMRDLGTPVYPKRFFDEMLRTFPEHARVFTVKYNGQPVASAVTQRYRDIFEVPSASSLREFRALCPNILLYWEMVRFAVSSGAKTFDFGRSTPGDGTFLFKQQWGGEPQPLVWEYWTAGGRQLPDRTRENPKFAAAIAAWQKLPVPVATALGPAISRNIP